jgi:hypothetical protein
MKPIRASPDSADQQRKLSVPNVWRSLPRYQRTAFFEAYTTKLNHFIVSKLPRDAMQVR